MDKVCVRFIFKRFILLSLLFSVLFTGTFFYYYINKETTIIADAAQEELANTRALSIIISNYISEISEGLHVVHDADEMQAYIED